MHDLSRTAYTSVFGEFEKIWSPLDHHTGVQFIAVTDQDQAPKGWAHKTQSTADLRTPRLLNRHEKMLFHPASSTSLYLDANVRPIKNLRPLFDSFEESNADLGLYPHYTRSSVRAEAEACLQRDKVRHPDRVPTELDLYSNEGFPDDAGLWEGSVIFKNHQSPKLAAAMNEWWDLYSRFENRDQFSLPFIIWKHGLSVLNLDSLSHGREHYFHRVQHSSHGLINRTARYLQARAPESAFWSSLHRVTRRVSSSQ